MLNERVIEKLTLENVKQEILKKWLNTEPDDAFDSGVTLALNVITDMLDEFERGED